MTANVDTPLKEPASSAEHSPAPQTRTFQQRKPSATSLRQRQIQHEQQQQTLLLRAGPTKEVRLGSESPGSPSVSSTESEEGEDPFLLQLRGQTGSPQATSLDKSECRHTLRPSAFSNRSRGDLSFSGSRRSSPPKDRHTYQLREFMEE